jgi:hypothetical protein
MIRQLAIICVLSVIFGLSRNATADGLQPPEKWHVDAAPDCHLVQGWMLLQKDGPSLLVREYAGGIDLKDVSESLDLSLRWFEEDGKLRLVTTREWKDKKESFTSTPSIPKGAELRVTNSEKAGAITGEYKVLWRADAVQKGEIVGTLVYVARLAPAKDGVANFDAGETTKAVNVVNRSATATR